MSRDTINGSYTCIDSNGYSISITLDSYKIFEFLHGIFSFKVDSIIIGISGVTLERY